MTEIKKYVEIMNYIYACVSQKDRNKVYFIIVKLISNIMQRLTLEHKAIFVIFKIHLKIIMKSWQILKNNDKFKQTSL